MAQHDGIHEQGIGEHGIRVVGTGIAAAAADEVLVRLAVDVLADDAGVAFTGAGEVVERVLQALADVGVETREVRTADLTLQPRTEYRDGREELLGYAARQNLVVRHGDLGGVERLLSAVVAEAGNAVRIDSVSLAQSNPLAARDRARAAAFADALRTAGQYAELAGRRLGRVIAVTETPDGRSAPVAFKAMAARDSMPIAGGDADVTVSCEVLLAWAD